MSAVLIVLVRAVHKGEFGHMEMLGGISVEQGEQKMKLEWTEAQIGAKEVQTESTDNLFKNLYCGEKCRNLATAGWYGECKVQRDG